MLGVNSLPKTVTRQRRGCDLNSRPTAPESSTLITCLPSHPRGRLRGMDPKNHVIYGGARRRNLANTLDRCAHEADHYYETTAH